MKLNLVFALAAVLAASPLLPVAAAEEKKDAAAEAAGPTPAQLKARKQKKDYYTNKFAEAQAMAEKCAQPLVVALLPEGRPEIQFFVQKVIMRREFTKDFAKANCVLLFQKIKADGRDAKKIETRGPKEPGAQVPGELRRLGKGHRAGEAAEQG